MGLDMHLIRKIRLCTSEQGEQIKKALSSISSVNPDKIDYIVEETGYWRKANHIHKWFVENVQDGNDDCGEYWVTKEELKKLLERVNTVIESCNVVDGKIEDTTVAEKLLPTQSGFFFGGTEYDEYYYTDLLKTKDIVEEALSRNENDFYYQSSW